MADVENIVTLYGQDTSEISASDVCRTYQTMHTGGCGTIEKYEIFPGIQLYNQIFNLSGLDYDRNTQRYSQNVIAINHCRLGRFEAEFADGEFLYLGEGDLAMNLPERAPVKHSFPLGYFQGITIIISASEAAAGMKKLESSFGTNPIRPELLRARLLTGNKFVIFRASPESGHILEEMYQDLPHHRLFYLQIKVLELLYFLLSSEEAVTDHRPYFHKTQVTAVKSMTQDMLDHLDKSYTLKELSVKYNISLSTMKKCFKSVYGMPVHTYLRNYRIQTAEDLLRRTDLSVAEIAEQVGYSNQSKFTAAFKQRTGYTPTAYRNLKS